MISALASPSSASSLWYLTRGTGTVALVLLTAVLVLGVLARGGRALPACPRFVTPALHRNLSLLAVFFLAIHILTAVADPYAPIRLVDAVVPFVSAYRSIWVGLGALAFDLLLALIGTSLVRERIGQRTWRVVHWAAYASWPVAVAHGLGTGTDASSTWLLALSVGSGIGVLGAVLWRIFRLSEIAVRRRNNLAAVAVGTPLALAVFALLGPLAPHWAARAGTPQSLLSHSAVATSATVSASGASTATGSRLPRGEATFSGRSRIHRQGAVDVVVFAAALKGKPGGSLRIALTGRPDQHRGVSLSSGSVRYSNGPVSYAGPVTTLDGGRVEATLTGRAGQIDLVARLTVAASQAFAGSVTMS
jgi:methionine sulfoxide reductase heme-binding subunit